MAMPIAKTASVSDVQSLLNGAFSRLAPLKCDGIQGPKTRARILEFQQDNGLKADGIVGPRTLGKLRLQNDPSFLEAELRRMTSLISSHLSGSDQQRTFMVRVQKLTASQRPSVRGEVAVPLPILIVIFFIFLLMMVIVLQSSHREADRKLAQEMDRRAQRLRELIKGKPLAIQVAETLKEIKQRAKEIADRAKDNKDKCLANLTPEKEKECEKILKKLSEAIQSLLQKIRTPVGGGITPEKLVEGIGFSITALLAAAKAASECTGCEI